MFCVEVGQIVVKPDFYAFLRFCKVPKRCINKGFFALLLFKNGEACSRSQSMAAAALALHALAHTPQSRLLYHKPPSISSTIAKKFYNNLSHYPRIKIGAEFFQIRRQFSERAWRLFSSSFFSNDNHNDRSYGKCNRTYYGRNDPVAFL